jgi:hypothetical protein
MKDKENGLLIDYAITGSRQRRSTPSRPLLSNS